MRRLWRRCAIGLGLTTLLLGAYVAWFVTRPLPAGLLDYREVASVKILDRDGRLLRELRSREDGRSTPLRADDIPDVVKDAFIAAEDHRFHSHPGVDPIAITRAAIGNFKAGRVVSGGSTLTQQLARALVPRPRTLAGKVQEALWALRLEAQLSKEEILAQYLNRVPFGNGTFGVEAASQLYFGREARYLSVGQAAVLASIPRGPTAYNPYRHPERLDARKRWVVSRMEETERLTAEAASQAKDEPIDLRAFTAAFRAPHFVDFVARNLERWGLGEATVIQTTLDPDLQAQVEALVADEVSRLADRGVGSAAALVIDNATGEVLAYVGSADFFDDVHQGQNDGVQMLRQPGSVLKPFAYLEAFLAGDTPATVLADVEAHFPGRQGAYSPENYDRRVHGPVRAREALANSYNVPAVRLAESLGPDRILRMLHAAGFESLERGSEHYGLGVVLGNGEVSMWEAARAYAGLSRGGVLTSLRPLRRAVRSDGAPLRLPRELEPRRFAGAPETALVTHVLADNTARARAFGLDSVLRLPFPSAAKTGTSKGYSDNWTVGYTRERTVAVWAGNFDGSAMTNVSGITGAGPIFRATMIASMRGVRPAPLIGETTLEQRRICPHSGQEATHHCPSAMEEVFVRGRAPKGGCTMHAQLAAGLEGDLAERCAALAGPEGTVTDLGPDFYDWARAEGIAREPWLAALCREAAPGEARRPEILFPARNAEFLLFPDLPLADQAIPVRVRAPVSTGELEVRVDGEVATTLRPPFVGRIPARKGVHVLSVHRAGEQTPIAEVRFTVRMETSTIAVRR